MITNSTIACGDQLGAQLTTMAALMYIGERNHQPIVFWKELMDYKRGMQFFDVFDIDGVEIISRCSRVSAFFIQKYCQKYKKIGDWRKRMRRIYNKKSIYRYLDAFVYRWVRMHYRDFINLSKNGIKNGVHTDSRLLHLKKNKNYDIQSGFGTYKDWSGGGQICITSRFHFKMEIIEKGEEIFLGLPTDKKKVSVHIRRTDYLVMSSLNLDESYYKMAMSYFDPKEYRFFVFSDDVDGCKTMDIFQGMDVVFMEQQEAGVDLFLMSKCDANIIANSTFSVWGALLNGREDKMVVCPHDFIGSDVKEVSYINGNYYPDSWIAI